MTGGNNLKPSPIEIDIALNPPKPPKRRYRWKNERNYILREYFINIGEVFLYTDSELNAMFSGKDYDTTDGNDWGDDW